MKLRGRYREVIVFPVGTPRQISTRKFGESPARPLNNHLFWRKHSTRETLTVMFEATNLWQPVKGIIGLRETRLSTTKDAGNAKGGVEYVLGMC